LTTRRILVIEHDATACITVQQILTAQGYEVFVAQDGRAGTDLCRHTQFDLVDTDLIMPDKEGLETFRELRANVEDLKIIAMSGGGRIGTKNLLQVARLLGADDILPKPFEEAELLEKVSPCLNPLGGIDR